uniref:Uncharacterized protein n=1 Tax=Anguilla anguilla TaxID=7936 RepID=A0A0E9PFH3_ANGAN
MLSVCLSSDWFKLVNQRLVSPFACYGSLSPNYYTSKVSIPLE